MLTPADHGDGLGGVVLAAKNEVLLFSYAKRAERYVNGKPVAKVAPPAGWINSTVTGPAPDAPS